MDITKWCKLLLSMSKCVAVTTVRSTNGHPNGLLQVELIYNDKDNLGSYKHNHLLLPLLFHLYH